jgi:hypothetical protein
MERNIYNMGMFNRVWAVTAFSALQIAQQHLDLAIVITKSVHSTEVTKQRARDTETCIMDQLILLPATRNHR